VAQDRAIGVIHWHIIARTRVMKAELAIICGH
jgi:hypothetical protein